MCVSNLIGRGSVDPVSDIVVVRQKLQAQEIVFEYAGPRGVRTFGINVLAVRQRLLPCLVLFHHQQFVIIADNLMPFGAPFAVPLLIDNIKIGTVSV